MSDERIELRSDTMTLPTREMLQAMYSARVGDETWGEDPTVTQLEKLAAETLEMEDAVFCVSGTMANTISILAHVGAGDAMVLGQTSHISVWESPSSTCFGITQLTVPDQAGCMDPQAVLDTLERTYWVKPKLLCLENTHNFAGGQVLNQEAMDRYCELAHERGAVVHVDGARIFNAAAHLGTDAAKLVRNADSVMFSLSKGLSAPMGSLAVGSRDFIQRARHWRKVMGGGLRQAGYMTAAGIVALRTCVERLKEDNEKARGICARLSQLPELAIDPSAFPTNIITFSTEPLGLPAKDFSLALSRRGVLVSVIGTHTVRVVTHRCVSPEGCRRAADLIIEEAERRLSK